MKRLITLVMALALVCLCAAGLAADVKIGVSLYNMNNPHFVLMADAIKAKCEELGFDCIITDPNKDNAKQVSAAGRSASRWRRRWIRTGRSPW